MPFFKKFLFPSTSWVLNKWCLDLHSKGHITLWNFIRRSLTLVMSDIARKNRPKSFILWNCYLFFQKFRFQQPLDVTEMSWKFYSKGQNSIWTPINCHLRFVTLDRARKYRPKSFLQWKVCFYFQNICFQQTLRWYRKDPVTSPVIVGRFLDYILPLSFVTLDNAR